MEFESLLIDEEEHADQINEFTRLFGIYEAAPGRISGQLAIDLYVGNFLKGDIDAGRVMQEIHALEGHRKSTTKKPTKFRKPPLKGLWHKHHLELGIHSLAQNILHESNRLEFRPSLELLEFCNSDATEERKAEVIAASYAHAFAHETYKKRVERKAMTGEWIIYAKYEGLNYYLCLGEHGGDDKVVSKLKGFPMSEFAFLGGILDFE